MNTMENDVQAATVTAEGPLNAQDLDDDAPADEAEDDLEF